MRKEPAVKRVTTAAGILLAAHAAASAARQPASPDTGRVNWVYSEARGLAANCRMILAGAAFMSSARRLRLRAERLYTQTVAP
jgi:hypothetical protein